MSAGTRPASTLLRLLAFCVLAFSAADARADLTTKQARKAITKMPGFELTTAAVHVQSVTTTSPNTAEATALVRTVFKFQKNEQEEWQVAEIRVGPDRWEQIHLISLALGKAMVSNECIAADPPSNRPSATEPSVKRARCLLGSLLGIETPSDALRIQEVSELEIPMASQSSAVVVTWVQIAARLANEGKAGWQVSELRSGKHDWVKLRTLLAALDEAKRQTARDELGIIAAALEKFRQARGSYVVSEQEAVVIDHLSPFFLARIIRLDPWHKPYNYKGDSSRFTLSSSGPDGKEDTPDDLVVTNPAR
ncbi:MAG: type II secretion system protein GspG [bacterium]